MPPQYEAIRDSFIKKGMSTKNAKTKAAKIYNAKHKSNPVGRYENAIRKSQRASSKGR